MKKLFISAFLLLMIVSIGNAQWTYEANDLGMMVGERLKTSISELRTSGRLPYIRGTWYFVDGTRSANTASGKTQDKAFKSLDYAYNACTSGAGDGIVILSRTTSSSSNTVRQDTTLTWAKYGITVYGMAAPNGYMGRARISHNSAADSLDYLLLITGQNNTFINLNFYNNPENDGDPVAATDKVSAVKITGARNAWINVHFNCTPQSANAYVNTGIEIGAGGDENTFNGCYFGSSSFDAGDNAACWIHISGAVAQDFFTDCTFLQQVSEGTAFGAVESFGATALNGIDIFKRCTFAVWRANSHAAICASWFIGTKPNTGNIGMLDCLTIGFTALDAVGGNDVVWTNQPAGNAAGGIGVAP